MNTIKFYVIFYTLLTYTSKRATGTVLLSKTLYGSVNLTKSEVREKTEEG